MKKVVLVNGSLSGSKSSSLAFLKDMDRRLPDNAYQKEIINVRLKAKDGYPPEILENISKADAVIIIFPLHNYGMPGALMRLMEDYHHYVKAGGSPNKDTRVYMIVNYAFPRPIVSTEAIRVMQNFCRCVFLKWRFAISIGTGPVVVMERKVPFFHLKLKRALSEIPADIMNNDTGERSNYSIKPLMPEAVIAGIKKHYEKKGQMLEKPREF